MLVLNSQKINRIITTEFASPDLEFAWTESRAQDPSEAASIDVAYVGAGILTVDEVRANMGLAPLPASANAIPSPVKKNFRKSDDGDEEDDSQDDDDESDDEDSSDGGDEGDDGDDSDFDAKHPRWPAGTPGDIGGQFAPKDSGNVTQTLHDAIASASSGSGSASCILIITCRLRYKKPCLYILGGRLSLQLSLSQPRLGLTCCM